MFWNFVCDKAHFKLYPILDWQPVKFFNLAVIMGKTFLHFMRLI